MIIGVIAQNMHIKISISLCYSFSHFLRINFFRDCLFINILYLFLNNYYGSYRIFFKHFEDEFWNMKEKSRLKSKSFVLNLLKIHLKLENSKVNAFLFLKSFRNAWESDIWELSEGNLLYEKFYI